MRLPFDGNYPITNGFGVAYHRVVTNPDGTSFGQRHHGIDFGLPEGVLLKAPVAGVVDFNGPAGSAGNMTRLQGDNGVTYRLLHQSRVLGTGRVVEGQAVGYSGNTGESTGPHLHIDTAVNGKYVNPMLYIGSDMFEGKTAEQWAKEAKTNGSIATTREGFLTRIALAAGDDADAVEGDDVDRIIQSIADRNKKISDLEAENAALKKSLVELKPGNYRVQ